jgi:hypothetical protein
MLQQYNNNQDPMKKQFLKMAFATAIVAAVATGCSSEKAATGSDSTSTDSSATMSTPASDTTARDTMRTDTAKTDTTKKPPMQ